MTPRVLVTGATGYVGSRLVPVLLEAGAHVTALGRDANRLREFPWSDHVDLAVADLSDREAMRRALEQIDVVVFLVHAMGGGKGYAERESEMARILAEEAAAAGVGRILYLSGLHPDLPLSDLSEHMASRERVAQILSAGTVPTLVLQAATIIGGGSASFEIIRHLADRLPVMPAPRWVSNRIEPVAIDDVLHYLVAGSMCPKPIDGAFALGSGESHLRFRDLLTEYAKAAGLSRRIVLGLPIPAPLLSGLWIALITPLPRTIALPLAQSMQHEAISHGTPISEILDPPADGHTPYPEAVRRAIAQQRSADLADLEHADLTDAPAVTPFDPPWAGARVREIREMRTANGGPSAPARLRRLLAEGAPVLHALSTPGQSWTLRPGSSGNRAVLITRARGRAPVWLDVAARYEDGGASEISVRLVSAPEGFTGFLSWVWHRPRQSRALAALADELAAPSTT